MITAMLSVTRWSATAVLLASSACGRVGVDLLDEATLRGDAHVDPNGADASTALSADASASLLDAKVAADAAGIDGGVPGACDLSGTYAAKILVNVDWPFGAVKPGSGTFHIWARIVGTTKGGTFTGTLVPCGITIPDFSMASIIPSETYHLDAPTTAFDHDPPYIAPVALTLQSSADFAVGSTFMLPALGVQVGSALANPASDPWSSGTQLPTTDVDADGHPGITLLDANGGDYRYPPVNLTLTQRADQTYAAARVAMRGTGSVESCTDISGVASVTSFDTHIVGCRLTTGDDCSSMQVDMLDQSRPQYQSKSATLVAKKLMTGATCAEVRSALP